MPRSYAKSLAGYLQRFFLCPSLAEGGDVTLAICNVTLCVRVLRITEDHTLAICTRKTGVCVSYVTEGEAVPHKKTVLARGDPGRILDADELFLVEERGQGTGRGCARGRPKVGGESVRETEKQTRERD